MSPVSAPVLVFLHISKVLALNAQQENFCGVISRGGLFIRILLTPIFSFNGPPLLGARFRWISRAESDVIYSLA